MAVKVTVEGEQRVYGDHERLLTAARDYQSRYDSDILLAKVDGKLRELQKEIIDGTNITFVTGKEKPGIQTYERSATLLMLKAFYDVAGKENVDKVKIEFSLGQGFFVSARGRFTLDQAMVEKIKERMKELVKKRLPIEKKNVHTDQAIEAFHKYGMYDKEKLFKYRRVSRVNLYCLGGFEDYYYGYMVPDTGYLKYFDLVPYEAGFMLMLPRFGSPTEVPEFVPLKKLYCTLMESTEWGEKRGISCTGDLNEEISKKGCNEMILIQEAFQEKKIAELAQVIAEQPDKKIVMIAGPSSSGKTTFSRRLSIQLQALGLTPHPVSVDDYFVNREDSPRDENGNYDYEALECIDLPVLNRDMTELLQGKRIELPRYNFKTGRREYRGEYLTMGKSDILVMEGIHCLNHKLTYDMPRDNQFKIYISALTTLNIDEHNRVSTTDGRLLRRMVRDARTRGNSALDTIRMWPSVRRGEEKHIFPFQEEADAMFNSSLLYELAVLKQYAEPLLFGIPRDCPEYLEAKRLLKFLDYFLGIDSRDVPNNSLLREFIGGSCFNV
ncbi:MAG: nucleoside kinase [Lachnoclostridium edouardi]|uniref:nucleoside kinase n=1 Tax=Lachnoclostridium edouardi TaxID=1926283 RepID=UPI0026DD2FC4|nr:nucleoside kinase [Lachnoclostridium edouardi]MDO4278346.1 nucleoside kinase [Lachnoclostridium edouardi]